MASCGAESLVRPVWALPARARRGAGGARRGWSAVPRSAGRGGPARVAGGCADDASGPRVALRTRPRRATRCSSTTRAPAAARRSASSSPTRRAREGSSRSSSARRGTSSSSSAARSPRRRRAGDGRRRRLAGDRRGDRRRARPALRLHPGRHAQPLRARPRRRPRRCRRRARRLRRRRRAARRPRRGQRARVRQQRLARALRRGRPARRLPRRQAAHDPRHPARRARARGRRSSTCAGPGPADSEHSSGAAILVSNNRYRLGRAVGSGTRPRIDDGLLGITVVGAPPGAARAAALQRPWREWSAPTFEVDADRPIAGRHRRRGAGARPAAPLPHPARASCACGSPASTPAPRPRRSHPTASGPASSS